MRQKKEDFQPLDHNHSAHRLSELEGAIQNKNYALAVRIAESIGKPRDEIRGLQQEPIKQFIGEYRNPQGAVALAEWIKEYL